MVQINTSLSQQQLEAFASVILVAQDNLNDRRGGDWESFTSAEDKILEFGTTDFAEAEQLLQNMADQVKSAPIAEQTFQFTPVQLAIVQKYVSNELDQLHEREKMGEVEGATQADLENLLEQLTPEV